MKYQITFPEVKALAERGEKDFSLQIGSLTENILENGVRTVLLTGPSSSGKTSCAERIRKELEKNGKFASVISLDDFFYDIKERDKIKCKDLESVKLLDIDLLAYCIEQLMAGEATHMPTFDFANQKRSFSGKQKMLRDGEILIIEGIHALNPKVTAVFENIPHLSVYISVVDDFIFEDGEVIEEYEIRKLRRLVRDFHKRGSEPDNTLEVWKGVKEYENKQIIPCRQYADFEINSYFEYEAYISKKLVMKTLEKISDGGEFEEFKKRFTEIYKKISAASSELVCEDSILHEFIG